MEKQTYSQFNEHGVCPNPRIAVSYPDPKNLQWNKPHFCVLTAQCETGWSFATEYELLFAGGGYYPRKGGTIPTEKECIVAGLEELCKRIKSAMECTHAQTNKETAKKMLYRVKELLAVNLQYELF